MSENDKDSVVKELNLQYRTMDMLLTIHEKLHDRYQFRAGCLDLLLLLASVALCLTTFVDPRVLQSLQISPDKRDLILGSSALLVFAVSIIAMMIDWKKKVASFGRAAETLRNHKSDCQEKLKLENPDCRELQANYIEYSSILNNLPKIPERDFYKLKAFYKRQTELGKMIDLYPGSSVWLLRVLICFKANWNLMLRKPF
jgi:hypothetical protein